MWLLIAAHSLQILYHSYQGTIRMKRFLLALFFIAAISSSHSVAQFGIAAGMNFETMSDISGSREATFENVTGYHAGMFYDFGLGAVGLKVGAYLRDLSNVEMNRSGFIDSFDIVLIDVPVDLRFNLTATPVIRPYILAGPVFSFPSSTNEEYDKALEKVNVSGNVGGGFAIDIAGVTLFPEIRYVIGVTRFLKDKFEIGGFEFDANEAQRQNSVMLRLGIGF